MITLYALLLLNLVRQSTTSPPQSANDWAYFLIGVILSVLIGGGVLTAVLKNWTDDQALKNEAARAELKTSTENAAVRRTEDTNQSLVFVELVGVLKSMSVSQEASAKGITDRNQTAAKQAGLLAINNDLMETLTEKVAGMIKNLNDGRAEIISGVSAAVTSKETDDLRYQENVQTVGEIKAIVAALDGKVDTIIKRLDESPTAKGYQEASQQMLAVLNTVKVQLAAIEAHLLVSGSPPADSPPVISQPEVTL